MNRILPTLLLSCSLFSIAIAQQEKRPSKLTTDELVAKHLASIGEGSGLAHKSMVLTGTGTISSKLGAKFLLTGPSQMASAGRSFVLAMAFDSPIYPYEKIGFDGDKVYFGYPNGKTTVLGNYVKAHSSIVKDGLLGGALSTGWPLLDLKSDPKIKLDLRGTTKINDRPCYKVKYTSSRIGDISITLFFDSETFRHVRTEYVYTIEGRIGTSPTDVRSSSRTERYLLTEDFGNFNVADKTTLPFSYNISITTERQIGSEATSREWNFTVEKVYFDQVLSSEVFKVS
ncbi:MAG: hypothetical protein AB7V18_18640 [Pyrinomonadaceae bacterium]